ncbi:HNH endonuclease [Aliivibrio salmonicida]|uniref:HNH endonuclease n=1 Tax=Aliivibrio salmonicida TaxID=40269 RepID=UPI00406CAB7F
MLFSYTYVPHQMEKMQEFIDFIFKDVWCTAPIGVNFSADLFDSNDTYRELMSYFGFSRQGPKRGKEFYNDVKEIYNSFEQLKPKDITQLQLWYTANNSIENICSDPSSQKIIRYKDLLSEYPKLGGLLAKFYSGLYHNSLLGLAKIKELFNGMDSHNEAFFTKNSVGKCPFCGINDLKGIHHTRREAYDHYLPKYRYPFNSLNFRNLAPACHECNSSYKVSKDPVLKKTVKKEKPIRRKSFYPYSKVVHKIEININLNSTDVKNLHPDDINISFGPDNIFEEIETWKDVYGIDERYKAKCCSETDGISWISRVLDERINYNLSINDMFNAEIKTATNQPYSDSNFLKKAFLTGCYESGVFD